MAKLGSGLLGPRPSLRSRWRQASSNCTSLPRQSALPASGGTSMACARPSPTPRSRRSRPRWAIRPKTNATLPAV